MKQKVISKIIYKGGEKMRKLENYGTGKRILRNQELKMTKIIYGGQGLLTLAIIGIFLIDEKVKMFDLLEKINDKRG